MRRYSPATSAINSSAANTLDALRHVTGFPDLGLLRVLRPIPPASAGNGPSRRSAECRPVREPAGWFPRSVSNRSTGSAPNYAPATSPRLRRRPTPWPPESATSTDQRVTAHNNCCAGVRCYAALIRQVRAAGSLEKLSVAGSSRTPFCLGCRTRTIWRYWSVPSLSGLLSTLTPRSRGSGCPQLHVPAATRRDGGLPPPHGWKTPRGASGRLPTDGSDRRPRSSDPPDRRVGPRCHLRWSYASARP